MAIIVIDVQDPALAFIKNRLWRPWQTLRNHHLLLLLFFLLLFETEEIKQ